MGTARTLAIKAINQFLVDLLVIGTVNFKFP